VPDDPITPLAELAGDLHEMYLEFVRAGFSKQQAIYLLGVQVSANIRNQGGEPD